MTDNVRGAKDDALTSDQAASELPGYSRAARLDDELSSVMHRIAGGTAESSDRDLAWRLIKTRAAMMVPRDSDDER